MAEEMSAGVPPAANLLRHSSATGYVALSSPCEGDLSLQISDDHEILLNELPSEGVFGVCRLWWAVTTKPEYLASLASRRDLWRVMLPLLGLAMSLMTAAKGSIGINDKRLVILDVSFVAALLGAGWLPVRNLCSDLIIALAFASYLIAHRLVFHEDAALELIGFLAVLSLGCMGVHTLMCAGLLAVSSAAAAFLSSAHEWSPVLLAVGSYVLGLVAAAEYRSSSLFASELRSRGVPTAAGAVGSLECSPQQEAVVNPFSKDQAVGPDEPGIGTEDSSGEDEGDLHDNLSRGGFKLSPSAFIRRKSLHSTSGDSLAYSYSGYSSTKSSPMDLAALRGSSPSDVGRRPLPGGRPPASCGIVLLNEARATDFSPLSEVDVPLGLSEPRRQQRLGDSRRNKCVQTTTTLGASRNISMYADKETETTIAWATEGFFCRRCGLPPSLPKLTGQPQGRARLPRPRPSTERSEGSGRSSRSRRSRSSGGSSSSDERQLPGDAGVPMVSVFGCTSEETLSLSLEWAMKHWNLPRIPGMCCPWHTVVSVAKRVIKYEVGSQCDPLWSPLTGWQCQHCTGLNHQENLRCDMCFECNSDITET